MKFRLFSLLVLCLILAGIGFWGWHDRPSSQPEIGPVEQRSPSPQADFLPYSHGGIAVEDPEVSSGVALPPPSEHALPGEYTLFFTDQASLEAFVEKASSAGLGIRGIIPELLALRLSASGSNLSKLLEEGMLVDNNVRINAPLMPNYYAPGDLSGFNADVLKFLGVPNDPSHLTWGQGVKIAVLDTGWVGHDGSGDLQVRQFDLRGGEVTGDYASHGTAVAGLIGSTNPFAPGIAPGSEIFSVRVLDANGSGDAFTLADGILQAVKNGASIINMSLGGYGDSEVLRRAVDYAVGRGVVLVASSGNDGIGSVTYPAAYPNVIGVAAVDANSFRAPFSNFGLGVDVAAPGYQIHALWDDNEFIYFNGTSASAPLVSGMAARLLQTGTARSGAEVQELIRSYANDTGLPGFDPQYGAGVLSADRLEMIGQSGIYDMALAALYPATEQSDGSSFPLYVTFQNRGTEYIPSARAEILVNEQPFFYRFSGIDKGGIESVQIPVPEALLESGQPFKVSAKIILPERYTDNRPENNEGDISLSRIPDDG